MRSPPPELFHITRRRSFKEEDAITFHWGVFAGQEEGGVKFSDKVLRSASHADGTRLRITQPFPLFRVRPFTHSFSYSPLVNENNLPSVSATQPFQVLINARQGDRVIRRPGAAIDRECAFFALRCLGKLLIQR